MKINKYHDYYTLIAHICENQKLETFWETLSRHKSSDGQRSKQADK